MAKRGAFSVTPSVAIKAKYAAERAKRLRPEGNDQYQRLSGKFASLATDPYTPFTEREPVTDHVTFAFVGAGMSGLVVGARLKEAGFNTAILSNGSPDMLDGAVQSAGIGAALDDVLDVM